MQKIQKQDQIGSNKAIKYHSAIPSLDFLISFSLDDAAKTSGQMAFQIAIRCAN